MSLFIPITKVDVAKRLVYGTISEEVPDKAGEIMDYESAKPAFQEWSKQFHQASGGRSLGNVRAMHGAVAAGKLTAIDFDDENRRVGGVAKIVDEDEWEKVLEGVYTGFSIGGGYARRWPDAHNPQLMRYTPTLSEVSLVDNPAVPTATFEIIKRDGTVELRKFNFHKEPLAMRKDVLANDRDESDAAYLLNQLADLKERFEEEGDDDMIEHVEALEDYLADDDEEENPDEDEAFDDDEDDTTSHAYASELARIAQRSKIRKQAEKKNNDLNKFSSLFADMQERIRKLELQPMPAKGVLRSISKSDDRASREEVLEKLSPPDRARELMKIALANPVEI